METILKGVILTDPLRGLNRKTDLIIEDGVIKKIGDIPESDTENATVYEFDDFYCAPGFFDMHVHLREPGREHTETIKTGSDSAAAGGFTGIACMPNTTPSTDSAEVVNLIRAKSRSHLVDVFPIGAVTLERKGEFLAPLAEMHEMGAVAFSDDGVAVKTAAILRSAMEYTKIFNTPIIEHCEDPSMDEGVMNESIVSTTLGLAGLPSIAEDLVVARDIMVAEYTGGKVHIAHISTKNSIQLVREAKARGINVTAEVTPHHFTLTDESLKSYDTNYKMNPPLRTRQDVEAVIEGLKDGTIDCIASDHAPHAVEDKEKEFIYAPNGIIGLETQLGLSISELVNKKHLTIEDLIYKLAINPRKILNLDIPKIAEGEKANLTIFDAGKVWTVDVNKFRSKSKNTPFDKRLLTGKPVATINKGQLCFEGSYNKI